MASACQNQKSAADTATATTPVKGAGTYDSQAFFAYGALHLRPGPGSVTSFSNDADRRRRALTQARQMPVRHRPSGTAQAQPLGDRARGVSWR